MSFVTLSADLVRAIHDEVLFPGELTGEALDKSLEGALGRVENRLAYEMISDAFDLAAAYAVAVATGHVFNDGNKRTAFRVMHAVLALNGVAAKWNAEDVGPQIIRLAQGKVDEGQMAEWLRARL